MSLRDAVAEVVKGMEEEVRNMKDLYSRNLISSFARELTIALKASEHEPHRAMPEPPEEARRELAAEMQRTTLGQKRAAAEEGLGEVMLECVGGVGHEAMVSCPGIPPDRAKTFIGGQVYVYHAEDNKLHYDEEETKKVLGKKKAYEQIG